jgi:hypothetical protein
MTLDHDNCFFSQKCWFSVLESVYLSEKKRESAWRTKIDFFVLTKRSLLTSVSRVLEKIKRSLRVDFFLNADFFLIADFLTVDILASKTFDSRSLFFMQTWKQSSKMKIFDYSKKHYWTANLKNFVCCSKSCLCRKTRDWYWVSNSTFSYRY